MFCWTMYLEPASDVARICFRLQQAASGRKHGRACGICDHRIRQPVNASLALAPAELMVRGFEALADVGSPVVGAASDLLQKEGGSTGARSAARAGQPSMWQAPVRCDSALFDPQGWARPGQGTRMGNGCGNKGKPSLDEQRMPIGSWTGGFIQASYWSCFCAQPASLKTTSSIAGRVDPAP